MPSRAALVQILLFAALFRILLLFAGLPPGEPLRDDLAGRRIAYSRFLLYDDDAGVTPLRDGHVVSAGLDPYARSPQEIRDRYDDGTAAPAEEAIRTARSPSTCWTTSASPPTARSIRRWRSSSSD